MCKKSTKANWIALPRIRLFSQFAQRTIIKAIMSGEETSADRNVEIWKIKKLIKSLEMARGWVNLKKNSHTYIAYTNVYYTFVNAMKIVLFLSPWREFFVCGGTYETKSCDGRREADWQRAVAVARGSECFYSRPFCVAIVVVVGITHQLALV